MISFHRFSRAVPVALLAGGVMAACSNPVANRETHVVPSAIVISSDDQQLVRADRQTATGSLTVRAGTETEVLTVRFLDARDNPIDPRDEYHLRVAVAGDHAAVAEWTPVEPGGFEGRVRGIDEGSTTLLFEWVHGPVGSGHAEVSVGVDVTVTPMQAQ